MGDSSLKEAVSCEIRGFGNDFPSSNIFNNDDSSTKIDENNIIEKKSFEGKMNTLNNVSSLPQDEHPKPDLLNGHNNPDPIDRNNPAGDLLGDTDELPNSELKDGEHKVSETEGNKNDSGESLNKAEENEHSLEKDKKYEGAEDRLKELFSPNQELEESKSSSNPEPSEKNESSNSTDNHDDADGFTEDFDLHLSETQSFLTSSEPEQRSTTMVSESEESSPVEEESNDKVSDANEEKASDDVDMSNESSNNTVCVSDTTKDIKNDVNIEDSNGPTLNEDSASNESDKTTSESDDKKVPEEEMEVCEEKVGDKASDNVKLDEAEAVSEEEKETEPEGNIDRENEPEETHEKPLDSASHEEDVNEGEGESTLDEAKSDEKSGEVENVKDEESKEDESGVNTTDTKESEDISDSTDVKGKDSEAGLKVTQRGRPQRSRQPKKSEPVKKVVPVVEEKQENDEPMEVENETNETSIDSTPCSCEPPCHGRIETVSQHLNNACSQLDLFIKQKRRDDNKSLKSFLDMLKEIHLISQNKKITGESKISDHILIPEETPPKRKSGVKRKSNDIDTPLKESPRKRMNTEEKSAKKERKSNVDFKDLKGLAVFAKWPNSGWYYPGKVEELTGNDWKEATNVTVKFYDGLVRDMKNINILPAYLIPAGSMLCDLDDETEMIVLSCDGSNTNSVDFKLSSKENPGKEIELNFNKLAIRANNMKTIKQQLEPTTDVNLKKMHMVSLVSGRRSSRGKAKKDPDAEEKTTPSNQTERRSAAGSSSTPSKRSTPRRARN